MSVMTDIRSRVAASVVSQAAIARLIGRDNADLNRRLRGASRITPALAEEIAAALDALEAADKAAREAAARVLAEHGYGDVA